MRSSTLFSTLLLLTFIVYFFMIDNPSTLEGLVFVGTLYITQMLRETMDED